MKMSRMDQNAVLVIQPISKTRASDPEGKQIKLQIKSPHSLKPQTFRLMSQCITEREIL